MTRQYFLEVLHRHRTKGSDALVKIRAKGVDISRDTLNNNYYYFDLYSKTTVAMISMTQRTIFEHADVILLHVLHQMAASVELAEGKFVVISVIQYIHEVRVERVDLVEAWEVV